MPFGLSRNLLSLLLLVFSNMAQAADFSMPLTCFGCIQSVSQWHPSMIEEDEELSSDEPPLPSATQPSQDTGKAPSLVTEDTLDSAGNKPVFDDVWQRIRAGFNLPAGDPKLVAQYERWYASNPEMVLRISTRAHRYLHFIVEEVEKRGMPTEFALLPFIESGFDPSAYSIANAAGIWQFIPSTGKKFGMSQDWWRDERRDIVSATNGALDYLQSLYVMFGDWELALASYNWGEHSVQRAIDTNKKRGRLTDYAHINMPDETRNYVPKLLAIRNIVNNPARFKLSLHPIPNRPYFTKVPTTKHMDIKLVAKLAGISIKEFSALNPSHMRPVILHKTGHQLLLPTQSVENYQSNLALHDGPWLSWKSYRPKKGESLDSLAPRLGISSTRLKNINDLPMETGISDGQTLLIPTASKNADQFFEPFNMHIHPLSPQPVTAKNSNTP